jgi:hypothetical protein
MTEGGSSGLEEISLEEKNPALIRTSLKDSERMGRKMLIRVNDSCYKSSSFLDRLYQKYFC